MALGGMRRRPKKRAVSSRRSRMADDRKLAHIIWRVLKMAVGLLESEYNLKKQDTDQQQIKN